MTPQDKRRATLRARRIRDTAYHEAGHVVGFWLNGLGVSFVHARCDEPYSRRRVEGSTSIDLLAAAPRDMARALIPGDDSHQLVGLMADVVDRNRGGVRTGGHIVETFDEVAEERGRALLAQAQARVTAHWNAIETVAEAIIASPTAELEREDLAALRARLVGHSRDPSTKPAVSADE